MRFGASPDALVMASQIAAQAKVDASGTGPGRLVLVPPSAAGELWGTELYENYVLRQEAYSRDKTTKMIGLAVAGVVGVGVLYWLFKR